MDDQQRYDAGMQVRRAVPGDAHVDRSLQKLSPLNKGFQAGVYCGVPAANHAHHIAEEVFAERNRQDQATKT